MMIQDGNARMVKKLELVCFVGSAMMDAQNEGQQMGAFARSVASAAPRNLPLS
jgi:hypothetical protein